MDKHTKGPWSRPKMNWCDAVEYMRGGGKVRRKSWLKHDYIYIRNGSLFCDGGYPYLEFLKSTYGEWVIYE